MGKEIISDKCKRCKKKYDSAGMPMGLCKSCFYTVSMITKLERELVAEEFSLEKDDLVIAQQINDSLIKESSGVSAEDENVLTALIDKMLKDEKRKKRILKEIRKFQKKKG